MAKILLLLALMLTPVLVSSAEGEWPPGTYGPYVLKNIRVIDGDTIEANILVWPGWIAKERIRLYGWDTPEMKSKMLCERELARRAKEAVEAAVKAAQHVWLADVRGRGSFGRVLGTIVFIFPQKKGFALGPYLAGQGLARPYERGSKKLWCGHKV